jgi:hypothetical protein
MGAFYGTPQFSGDISESAQVAATFPSAAEGTSLRTISDGIVEANHPDSGSSLWYNSAHYTEPDAPHDSIVDSNGVGWYAMQPRAVTPEFETGTGAGGISENMHDYNRAQFNQFIPGYETSVSQVDSSGHTDGKLEVRHADGSGTAFYDKNMYQSPRGDHKVYEDSSGKQWYAVPGTPTVERRPVYENGNPVYDGNELRTTNVESIKYKTTPTKFNAPQKRDVYDRKPPKPKGK